jgi:SagB-type dehydrogenase family enzyme
MMSRRDVGLLTSLLLLPAVAFVAATGLLADALGLNDFVYHKYAGYVMAGLVALHVYCTWPRLVLYLRGWWARRRPPQQAALHRPAPDQVERSELLTRRWFLGWALGGVGGFLLGWVTAPGKVTSPVAGGDVGAAYHEWSKPILRDPLKAVLDWGRQPALYKEYERTEKLPLPPARGIRGLALEEAIERRRSVRDYTGRPLSLEELSRLLWYTCGISAERWGLRLRVAPSAGALYPIEVYPVIHNVAGLASGIYHYHYPNHALEKLKEGDFRATLIRYGVGQEFLGQANLVLALAAIFQRTRWKYQERTYRYVMVEAGHIGQNVYLAATSMGLGACAVGAFLDDDLNRLLEIDGTEEAVIYLLAVGTT